MNLDISFVGCKDSEDDGPIKLDIQVAINWYSAKGLWTMA